MVDFNSDISSLFREYAYPMVCKKMKSDDKLLLLYQTSSQPGSNVIVGTSTWPPVPVHQVDLAYREIPTSDFIATALQEKPADRNFVDQNYPNPVKEITSFGVNIDKPAHVTIEVSNMTGFRVMSLDQGFLNSGARKFTIDCNSLTSGVYIYTVKIGEESFTHKMIVE